MSEAQFAALLVTLDRIAAALERQAPRKSLTGADEELVRRIAESVGPRTFSSWEVIDHARLPGAAGLHAAILSAIGAENSLRLGKLLRRVEGLDVGGLRIERVGADREGALWRVAGMRE